jgi:DNA-directed RNA polymerase subunit RPC12/RpoP
LPGTTVSEYYKCPDCGSPYFVEQNQILVKKDDPRDYLRPEDYTTRPAITRPGPVVYVCAKCGKILDRYALSTGERVDIKPYINNN